MSIGMRMEKGEVSLDGYGIRKGFYGKCGVREVDGVKILRSYNVRSFAAAYEGRLVLTYIGEYDTGATSLRHLAAFAAYANAPYHGKGGEGRKDPYRHGNLMSLDCRYDDDATVAEVVKMAVHKIKSAERDRAEKQRANAA